MGGRRLGVRWTRPGLDADLRALLAGGLGPQDAPPNVSVTVGGRSGRTRQKHVLHVQGRLSYTTGSDGALVRAVIRALAGLGCEPPPGTVAVDAFMVIDPAGRPLAVDRRLATDVRALEPRLRRSGYRIVEVPHLAVRPEGAVAVLPDWESALGVSASDVDGRWPRAGTDDDLRAGDVEIAAVVHAGRPEPESRAAAVADMVPMVRDRGGRVVTSDVAALAALAAATGTIPALINDPGGVARALGLA